MTTTVTEINAFTGGRFGGNPAGVCLPPSKLSDTDMQSIAAQMNLSETAFLFAEKDGFRIRWFTPKTEVRLCGHATLASAFFLWDSKIVPGNRISFHSLSGVLSADRNGDKISLNFPAKPSYTEDFHKEIKSAFGIKPIFTGKSEFDYLIEFADEAAIKNLKPDFKKIETIQARGIIVTARSASPDYDFVSRFFAPAVGVNEDPVTGSAHCTLAPYWSAKTGKIKMTGFQASERGGVVEVELKNGRVLLTGEAEKVRTLSVENGVVKF